VISGVVMAATGMPQHGWFVASPLCYVGAVLVAFYVLSITYSAPRIGVANAVFFVLVGQIVAAGLIDQFGLFGTVISPLTWQRYLGIALMLAGTFLARRVA
jgi:transporter family-2 protein